MAKLGNIGGMTFLRVIDGKFAQRVTEGAENAEKRTNKNGKVLWERYYKTAEGVITKLEIRSSEYEGKTFKTMCITLDNEVQLQFSGGIDNAQNKALINALLTAKITDPIRFIAIKDEQGYSKVFPMQYEKGLKWFSTKDHPQGVPQPKKKKVAGEVKWDWDAQNEWYFDKFQELSGKVQSDKTETTLDDFPDNKKRKKEKLETTDELKGKEEKVNPDDLPF